MVEQNRSGQKREWLMKFAFLASEMSTCAKVKVGAVIVRGARIISTGYNGSAPGRQHCNKYFGEVTLWDGQALNRHHQWALKNEIHAEMNAIIFAAREGIPTKDCDIYVTHQPCTVCSKFIVQAGIKRVFYKHEYLGDVDNRILTENNVEVIQL